MAYWFRRSLSRGRTRIVQMMLQRREIRTPATVCCHWRLILYSFHSSAVGINSSQSVMNGSNVINICWIACCKGDCHSQGKTPNSLENSGSIFEFTKPIKPFWTCEKFLDFLQETEICAILAYIFLNLVAMATPLGAWKIQVAYFNPSAP